MDVSHSFIVTVEDLHDDVNGKEPQPMYHIRLLVMV